MDVEKLKRVNILANTLRQQGLAASSEDAVSMANTFVPCKQDEGLSEIFNRTSVVTQEQRPAEPGKQSFTEVQIKTILQTFADHFCSEINRLNEKHAKHEQAIAGLLKREQQPRKLSTEQLQNVLDEGSEVKQQTIVQKPVEQAPQKSPRSGSYNSQDVSIEKFFYYGNK